MQVMINGCRINERGFLFIDPSFSVVLKPMNITAVLHRLEILNFLKEYHHCHFRSLYYNDKFIFSWENRISGNDMDPVMRLKFVSECFTFCFSGRSILLYYILRSS